MADVRDRFPLLKKLYTTDGKDYPLVYFDNAATTQKPDTVINRLVRYYREENANVHRSIHLIGEESTRLYENARKSVSAFINADDTREIIFTSGATASINLAAWAWGKGRLSQGDGILLTEMEHHSNLVPWQLLAKETGAQLNFIPVNNRGELDLETLDNLLDKNIKLTALTWVSNVMGTENPVKIITARAHSAGSVVLVDGAQGIAHLPADVRDMNCDFFVFSAHKMFGPTGTGVLYAKSSILDDMNPWQGGGNMISAVWLDHAKWNDPPWKFEPGTPNIAGVLGLDAAVEFVCKTGFAAISTKEKALQAKLADELETIPGLVRYGKASGKLPVESFTVEGIHPHDLAEVLSRSGIAIRAGHHCAHPLMRRFGLSATLRASLALYNTPDEIDMFISRLRSATAFFRKGRA